MVFFLGKKIQGLEKSGFVGVLCTFDQLRESNIVKLWNKTKLSEDIQTYIFPQANVHFRSAGNIVWMLSDAFRCSGLIPFRCIGL